MTTNEIGGKATGADERRASRGPRCDNCGASGRRLYPVSASIGSFEGGDEIESQTVCADCLPVGYAFPGFSFRGRR